MKRLHFLTSTLLLVTTLFLSNGFTQDYVRYKTLIGHTAAVVSIAFSPDGKAIASGSWDNTIRLWNADTGTHIRTLTGHTDGIWSVAFSPDGTTLASGSRDDTIRMWDADTGAHIRTLTGHTSCVYSVAFSPDGQTIASGGIDIRLWDAKTGAHIRTLTRHWDTVYSVAFSPDGTTLASGNVDGTIRMWDADTGAHIRTLTGHTDSVWSVAFSPDGTTLASGSWDDTIRMWDADTGAHIRTLIGHTSWVYSVAFSPDGTTLASGGVDIRLWDAKTGAHKRTLTGHTRMVNSVSFSPDGQTLASGSGDNIVRLWKLTSPRPAKPDSSTLPKPADQVYNSAIRSVMWIVNPGIGEGSGVLIDKPFKLAITNAHVTSKQSTVDIYFPATDENGGLIKDRNFYLTNSSVLKQLGYYTKGHVVARDEETDLAIIRLDGLPETAREIDWSFTMPATNSGDIVYILGNPGGQELWRWTLGEFLNNHGDFLHLQSDVFGGNSGGPVLNKQGVLLGIIARSDRHMNALAIPARDINQLLSKSQLKHSRSRR